MSIFVLWFIYQQSWYEDYEYSSLPGSTFYTVLDNNYDKGHLPNELEGYPMKEFL